MCGSRSSSQAFAGRNWNREVASHIVTFGGIDIDAGRSNPAEIKERAAQSEVSIVNPEREEEIKAH